jgi:hypothetical protein
VKALQIKVIKHRFTIEDMKKLTTSFWAVFLSVFFQFALAQEKELVLGDWYFKKVTNRNGQITNQFIFFRDITFSRRGGTVVNQLQNSELFPKESFDFYVENRQLFLVRTRTNLDPNYAIHFIDFNEMILERDNAFFHFERILRQKHLEDTTLVFLQNDTLTLFKKPLITPRFNGDICRVLSDQFGFLNADTTGLLPITFRLKGSGEVTDINIGTEIISATKVDSLKTMVAHLKKKWVPGHRGSKRVDFSIRLQLLIKSRKTLPNFDYAKVNRLIVEANNQAEQLYRARKFDEANERYRDVLCLYEFIQQSMIHSNKSFDIVALDAYDEALLHMSELLISKGDKTQACVLLGKISRSNSKVEKLFLENCKK